MAKQKFRNKNTLIEGWSHKIQKTMNSKRPGAEKNAMTDKLYMLHGLRTVFHQLMAETGGTRLLSQKDIIYHLVT